MEWDGLTVVFTLGEMDRIREMADFRQGVNRSHHVDDHRATWDQNISPDFKGLIGECAVAALLNKSVHNSDTPSDPGYDMIYNGVTIDVKTCGEGVGVLALPSGRDMFRADVAVLCSYEPPFKVEIVGWIDQDTFAKERREILFGKTPYIGVPPSVLRPMHALPSWTQG